MELKKSPSTCYCAVGQFPFKRNGRFRWLRILGIFGDFEENNGRSQLGIEEDLRGRKREVSIFNSDTEEWKDAQAK